MNYVSHVYLGKASSVDAARVKNTASERKRKKIEFHDLVFFSSFVLNYNPHPVASSLCVCGWCMTGGLQPRIIILPSGSSNLSGSKKREK